MQAAPVSSCPPRAQPFFPNAFTISGTFEATGNLDRSIKFITSVKNIVEHHHNIHHFYEKDNPLPLFDGFFHRYPVKISDLTHRTKVLLRFLRQSQIAFVEYF